jgi:hypothetical protein
MFAKLHIPLLALAVTLGLAATPAEARRGGGGHAGHVGGHGYGRGYHGHGYYGHGVYGHGYRGGWGGGWGGGGFYSPFWCPYPPYCINP